ncbi:MAG: biopolymer transporter ExbD [Gammaproteobacteria bacterium]|nr:biopolymer transporter ExbD [Gammaproteobacteria bacterium]
MRRMERSKRNAVGKLNLTSLMDVFTILVFFLLINSGSSDVMTPPKEVDLPDSVVESKPRETVVVMVTEQMVLVMGEPVGSVQEIIAEPSSVFEPITNKLLRQKSRVIGTSTKTIAESSEVTILAHKTVPFKLLKKIMSSCTNAGYGKISLAVIEKAKQNKD